MGPTVKAFGYITKGLKYSANIHARSFHSTRVLKVDVSIFSCLYDSFLPYIADMEIPELLNSSTVHCKLAIEHGLKLLSYSQQPMSVSDPGSLDFFRYINSRELASQTFHAALEKIQEAKNLDVSLTDTVKKDLLDANGRFKDLSFINNTLKAKFR